MFSSDTIASLNADAALAAAQKNLEPFIPWDADEIGIIGAEFFRSIPNLGSLDISDTWDHVEDTLVDSSGFGQPGEPALTIDQALDFVIDHANESGSRGFAVTSQGQFQVVLSVFDKL